MRDRDECALESNQHFLQPLDGVKIQVVGWFVQQQNVRLGYQCLRQGHALLSPSGERADHRVSVKVQTVQRFSDPLLPIPAMLRFNGALQLVKVANTFAVLIDQGDDACNARARGYEDGRVRVEYRLLGDVSKTQILLQLEDAVVGFFEPCQNLQQGRLARSVATDQADSFAGFKRKVGVIQQRDVTESELGVQKC